MTSSCHRHLQHCIVLPNVFFGRARPISVFNFGSASFDFCCLPPADATLLPDCCFQASLQVERMHDKGR